LEASEARDSRQLPKGDWAPDSYTAFIKPDMLANVHSMVDFWLKLLCDAAKQLKQLPAYKGTKGQPDLSSRHRYLTEIAGLDLRNVVVSYDQLDLVRDVRNCFSHHGGHASERLARRLTPVPSLNASAGLIVIGSEFIWEALGHARIYLTSVAQELDVLPSRPAA
jgi:hypothetical protein